MLKFSPNIEAGHILQALMLAGALIAAWVSIKDDLAEQDQRIAVIEAFKISEQSARISEHSTRITAMEYSNLERQRVDKEWRDQISAAMKEITLNLQKMNESVIRIQVYHMKTPPT